ETSEKSRINLILEANIDGQDTNSVLFATTYNFTSREFM
ncbi:hypothetical protein MTO96_045820, partial [Rhipicephalus appendiculatus]